MSRKSAAELSVRNDIVSVFALWDVRMSSVVPELERVWKRHSAYQAWWNHITSGGRAWLGVGSLMRCLSAETLY